MALPLIMQLDLPDHRKFIRLKAKLKLPPAHVVGLLYGIWRICARYEPDGDLTDYTAEEIADAAGFAGDARKFIKALQESGFMDGMIVHDFAQNQGPAALKRLDGHARVLKHRASKDGALPCNEITLQRNANPLLPSLPFPSRPSRAVAVPDPLPYRDQKGTPSSEGVKDNDNDFTEDVFGG